MQKHNEKSTPSLKVFFENVISFAIGLLLVQRVCHIQASLIFSHGNRQLLSSLFFRQFSFNSSFFVSCFFFLDILPVPEQWTHIDIYVKKIPLLICDELGLHLSAVQQRTHM